METGEQGVAKEEQEKVVAPTAHLNNLSIRTKNAFSQASFNVIA